MNKWPGIESLKHVTKYVRKCTPYARVHYYAKVKLHGTNAGVARLQDGTLQAQSRSRVITPEDDNQGFAAWLRDNTGRFLKCPSGVTVFGEWYGQGIMKGTAASQVEGRHFAPFAVMGAGRIDPSPALCRAWSGCDSLPWAASLAVDFNDVEASRGTLERLLQKVEAEDPFILALHGVKGLGEGLVFYPQLADSGDVPAPEHYANMIFKLKGDKHKVKATKQKVELAPEAIASRKAFAEAFVTDARLDQCLGELGVSRDTFEMHQTGDVMRWMSTDIQKESVQELEESGMTWKDVVSETQRAVREKLRGL
jgi:hypothetical protein